MAATGFTPIQLYYSTTASAAPSSGNLANGELALNITDGKLFYKDNGGTVRVLAGTGGTGVVAGSNTQVQFNNNGVFGASSGLTWDGTNLTASQLRSSGLTSGRVTYAGASGLLVDSANMTFDGTTLTANALTVTNATTLSAGTANGVAYLNGSKVLTTGSGLVFDGTNLGLGVTPSAWYVYKAMQVGQSGAVWSNPAANELYLSSNYYYSSAGDKYIANGYASFYRQLNGAHTWATAPSGTAGNAITFTQAATLTVNGNYLLGTTSEFAGADCKIQAVNTSSAQSVAFFWNASNSGDNNFIAFATESSVTQRGSITYNRSGGLVSYNVTSDYRAKDIIGPVNDSGSVIDSVPVYIGKMKGATQERPMFIAHETPDYAHTGEKDAVDADGNPVYQQMDASALIPVMWAEIQSLRKRLAAAGI